MGKIWPRAICVLKDYAKKYRSTTYSMCVYKPVLPGGVAHSSNGTNRHHYTFLVQSRKTDHVYPDLEMYMKYA